MSQITATTLVFAPVAQRVQVHVVLLRWLSLLTQTLLPASLVLVLLVLSALRGTSLLWMPWLGLILWLAGSLVYAWWQRPGAFSALALWDQAAGRREAFASAWWFEQRDEGGEEAQTHIAAQREFLPQALPALKNDLPLRPNRWLLLPLMIAILGSFISAVTAPPSDVIRMDEEMTRKAAEEASKLAQTDWEKKKLAGLTDEEKQQIEDLKQKLQKTATDLANAGGKDARDVLAELERRARDAEKLADELGNGKAAWASEKLVEALRKHADTADLGDAVAAKNAKAAAKAAEALATQLKSPQINAETQGRMNETLQDVEKQSDTEDRKRTVGQNVLAAGDQMQQGKPVAAGEEFQKLADKLRDVALREQTRNELQELAQQLRDSGSSIAGQGENDGAMQQMSQAGQNGQSGQAGPQQQTPQVGQAQQQLNPPGMGQSQGQQNQMQQPQGGQGQGQQQQMLSTGQGQQGPPGQQGQPSNGQPMLMAPVPGGAKADDKAPIVIMPGEQNPEGNDGPTISIAMPGGNQPGVGKADLNNTPTPKQENGNQSVVQAQQGNEGQSTARSVEGGTRTEQSARTATQAALESIQAEEAALDEASLPPARREQVRRYFNELRKRFEKK